MTTAHQTDMGRLFARLKTKAAATVTYQRSGGGSVEVSAVPGMRKHQGNDDYGFPVETDSKAFVFEYSDIAAILTGSDVPDRGDTIEHDGFSYEVLPQGSAKQCWDWAGPGRILIRVYTDQGAAI